MATATKTKAAIGTTQWIQGEAEQAEAFIQQEVEEFGYSVRNDLEWLNEHMAEVLSKGGVNFADVFKTPGKLRGKTPRTARKVNAIVSHQPPRQPLTDIFAPNAQIAPPSAQQNAFYDKVAHFQIAQDQENDRSQQQYRPTSRSKSPLRVGKPGNTDSGYHGMTEDEMEVDVRTETATVSSQVSIQAQKVLLREDQARPRPKRLETADGGGTSDESFMSAREDLTSRNASREQLRDEQDVGNVRMDGDEKQKAENLPDINRYDVEPEMMDEDGDVVGAGSPSDASSPEKPLQRKSSFTFSALPAREPLTAKRSIGARNSQIDVGRNSVLTRSFGQKSMSVPKDEAEGEENLQGKPDEFKVHNKTSTQSLHERIKMLGKPKDLKLSKGIAHAALGASTAYPQLPIDDGDAHPDAVLNAPDAQVKADEMPVTDEEEEDDDDWIAPSKPAQVKAVIQMAQSSFTPKDSPRLAMHQKAVSTTVIQSPMRSAMNLGHHKAQSISHPSLASAAGTIQSTTPVGSPAGKKTHEGPLSASKNKLWSALKSAKNIFASSASASAAAKLEAHNSPAPVRSLNNDVSDDSRTAAVFNMPGALYSERQLPPQSPIRQLSVISASPSRKTRSSSESDKKREKELKAQQKAAEGLEKAREKERQKAAKEQEQRQKAEEADVERNAERGVKEAEAAATAQRPMSAENDRGKESGTVPLMQKSMPPAGKLRAPGRLMRPTRNEPTPKPAPVSIRIASQSQRLGQVQSQSALSKSQHESVAPPPPPKTGLRTTSAQGNVRSSTAPNNAHVKALAAAARKKEADEKAAQKKADQKREIERKRAAKAEEERRAEDEKKAAEQQRIHEAKLAAQRRAEQLAVEARRREQQRLEQQRQQEEAQKAKAAYELAEAIKRERAGQAPAHPRGDVGGTLRQIAKNTVPDPPPRPPVQPNPAKPAKRVFQTDDDELIQHPQRPGLQRGPPSYQQSDAKRRRTNEDQEQQTVERHSVMAPPKRPSNMRKESTFQKFPHGYTHAPPPAAHHASSMFKATVTAQHQLQHSGKPMPSHPSQTVQVSNARIPFAENHNPPAHPQIYQLSHPGHENSAPVAIGPKYKTPVRPAQAPKSAKSSPMYPKGDNIELPEIATDSEDEGSEDDETGGFRAPSWVASPALRDLLTQQQLVDPETIFGPIAELKMDEVFKNGKNQERLKKFRDRGSSAAWVETGDAVTSAEKRRDMEMRERVVREGGWRFEPAPPAL